MHEGYCKFDSWGRKGWVCRQLAFGEGRVSCSPAARLLMLRVTPEPDASCALTSGPTLLATAAAS